MLCVEHCRVECPIAGFVTIDGVGAVAGEVAKAVAHRWRGGENVDGSVVVEIARDDGEIVRRAVELGISEYFVGVDRSDDEQADGADQGCLAPVAKETGK